jgi:malate dehydrogenase
MLRSVQSAVSRASSHLTRRGYATEPVPERKVAILGAAGGIGQPLSLLMKLNPLVSTLSLYDIAGTPGVAADVSHINSRSEVFLHTPFRTFCKYAMFYSFVYQYTLLIEFYGV